MRRKAAVLLLILATVASHAMPAAQTTGGRLLGVVADESGGVLPGVTVTAQTNDGHVLATAVTSERGRYVLSVRPGAVELVFSLEGFTTAVAHVTANAGVDLAVEPQRLTLAPRTETVTVQGELPKVPPAPKPEPRRLPPPPPPVIIALPDHDRDSICGPAKPDATPESLGIIQTGRSQSESVLFSKDDQVIVEGGTSTGLSVGQNVVARRTYHVGSAIGAAGEHTAGVLQIVSVQEHTAIAVVVYTCDEIMRGDRLASFAPEPVRAPEPQGVPAFDDPAQILFGDEGQLVGAPRRFMVIDRGRTSGLHSSQRLVVFRRDRVHRGPVVVGEAVIVAVRGESATIRIDRASDAIAFGDWVAPQRFAAR